ncbi:uncharacterized protein F5891DRAFT_1026315 [Suillus fuscotomentosus]|uniref:Uncharacterized protein n=1 Tax=Suillus fuscotomentosus TaxID=1912939 RepID=A0AAD4E904_9AGAM|nr:uncharacterized protein F5891DRAFT_1026315 [Suillus fuscotomentosus]KAG1901945.1 hypothetical protein F5891DRAFT_1026315 [Suillus fuscotomentosus]
MLSCSDLLSLTGILTSLAFAHHHHHYHRRQRSPTESDCPTHATYPGPASGSAYHCSPSPPLRDRSVLPSWLGLVTSGSRGSQHAGGTFKRQ